MWRLTSVLFVACLAGNTDSGQHTPEADQDELILLQVRTAFVPGVWQDPDSPLDPGLGLNENTPPPQEQEEHFPTLPDLPGWNQPDVPDPFEWPSPAECEGGSFALLNISNGQADGIFWRCTGGQTMVSLGGSCIPVEKRCDGIKHCEDGSDELDCNVTSQESPGARITSEQLDGGGDKIANVAIGAGNSNWQVTKAQQLAIPSSDSSGADSLWSGPAVVDQVQEAAATGAPTDTIDGLLEQLRQPTGAAADVPGLPGWPAEGVRSATAAKEYQEHLAQTGLAGLGLVLVQDEAAFLQVHAVFIPGTWQDPDKALLPGLGPSPRLKTQAPPSIFQDVPSLSKWNQPAVPHPSPDFSDRRNFESLPTSPAASPAASLVASPAAPTDWTHPVDCVGPSQYLTNGEGDDNFWRCIVGGNCIYVGNRCDGIKHCTDGSDELYCNTKLLKRVHDLEATNTELQDEVNYLRTGNTERLADYNTLRASLSSLNSSLQSDLNVLRSRSPSSSSIQPHEGLQAGLETLKAENTVLQNEINAIQTKNTDWQTVANSQLAENITSLRTDNVDLLSSVAALKENYVKLQLDLHPS